MTFLYLPTAGSAIRVGVSELVIFVTKDDWEKVTTYNTRRPDLTEIRIDIYKEGIAIKLLAVSGQ